MSVPYDHFAPQLFGGVLPTPRTLDDAAAVILPVPFGNMGPGIAICILAFALLERDGKATLAGLATTIAALMLAWGVILAIVKAVSLLVRHWLGI